MIVYNTKAKVNDSIPCHITWVDGDGKPLSVKNPRITIFYYLGVVRTELLALTNMQATDKDYRFITRYVIPESTANTTIFIEYSAQLNADDSEVIAEQTVYVEPISSNPDLPSNIISVV